MFTMSHIENQYQRRAQPVGPMLMCATCLSGNHSRLKLFVLFSLSVSPAFGNQIILVPLFIVV